jgi:hypothetical protein
MSDRRGGYVLLWRKLWAHPYFRGRPDRVGIFAYVIQGAEWRDGERLQRGEFQQPASVVARAMGLHRKQVQRFFQGLEKHGIAERKKCPSHVSSKCPSRCPNYVSTYVIVKYDTYQSSRPSGVSRGVSSECPRGVALLKEGNEVKEGKEVKEETTLGAFADSGDGKLRVGDPYSDEFTKAWGLWLAAKRPGANKKAAWRQWVARANNGSTQAEMVVGTKNYLEYRRDSWGTSFLKLPATFYGPDEHFRAYSEAVSDKNQEAQDESWAPTLREVYEFQGREFPEGWDDVDGPPEGWEAFQAKVRANGDAGRGPGGVGDAGVLRGLPAPERGLPYVPREPRRR